MRGIVPSGAEAAARSLRLSPGALAGGLVFVTGMTGSGPEGEMPTDPEAQFRAAFAKIDAVLREAGASMASAVEMTSYHVGLAGHFDLFASVRAEWVTEPYPAWTAVEVAGLRRPGALVEIRVVAEAP